MATSNSSEVLRTERNGVEYFTVVSTGESGMSQRGLSRACGKRISTIQNLIENLTDEAPSKSLKPFIGKDLNLTDEFVKKGGLVIVYRADFCAATIQHYAFKGSEAAQDFLGALGEIGLTSYIQTQTGWLPEQYTAAPQTQKRISNILDAPNPWKRLYDKDFCKKVYSWYGSSFYWTFCYSFLNPVERCKLNQLNPVENGKRRDRIHQYLPQDIRDRLEKEIVSLIVVVNLSSNKSQFEDNYQKQFGDFSQLELLLN